MSQTSETYQDTRDELVYAISQLQAKPCSKTLTAFLAVTEPNIHLDPELQFIASQAKVVLEVADLAAYDFLLNYFESKENLYAALCCAEALLLEDETEEGVNRHSGLLSKYNESKEKELAMVRETFMRNSPEKTISIIMPTYNRHQYIRQAIESVIDQVFEDFELIIINDGGSRECEEIIESFRSDRIRYLYVPHGGLSHALNQGILASRSKYIAYLDDDDMYFPDHLYTLVSALKSSSSFVYTDAYREAKKYENNTWNRISKTVKFSRDFDAGYLAENNYIPILCIGHRRDCFEQTGLFEQGFPNAMDWDMWARASRVYDFKHIKKITCLYEYRLGPDSLSGRQLDNLFYSTILRKHHLYMAKQVWKDLSDKADRGLLGYEEIENKTLRYQSQFVEWLLPLAFTERKWHRALSIITNMTRNHPHKAFLALRRICPQITVLARVFSFFIFSFISVEYVLTHYSNKGMDMLTMRGNR